MATHSSVLAWRLPGMGEPGGLLSMGSHESDTTEVTQQQQRSSVPGSVPISRRLVLKIIAACVMARVWSS